MDLMAFLAVLGALTAYVALPLYRQTPQTPDTTRPKELEDLLNSLRDLDRDLAEGLVTREDHEVRRSQIELDAARLMRAMEVQNRR